ncbi:MAG: sensor histidine kinase [Granulosicoccus sp.]
MKRLFLPFALHFLLALALSFAAASILSQYPVFRGSTESQINDLRTVGLELLDLLDPHPVADWPVLIDQQRYDDHLEIEWYPTNDNEMRLPVNAVLKARRLEYVEYNDNVTALELYFPDQAEIMVVIDTQPATEFLNALLMVLMVITICLGFAALALIPVVQRLQQLKSLASFYRKGQWQARNTDHTADPIGELGDSLEKMADQIQVLVTDNESLVNDQRDLMQALTHEFRAPLARMRFALDMHEDGHLEADARQEISSALDELNDMVAEMLHYAQTQSGPALHYDHIFIRQLVIDCCELCAKANQGVDIQWNLPDTDQVVEADATQLQRAIINLIGNAAKYGNQDQCRVRVSIEIEDTLVKIQVDDNGPGINPQDRQHVLKPFVRLDASRSKQISGNGLGLAIANGVALKHGGRVVIGDSVFGGARVVLVVPVVAGLAPQ